MSACRMLIAIVALAASACSETPVSPSAIAGVTPSDEALTAKPGGGTSSTPHLLQLKAPVGDYDGFESPGWLVSEAQPVSGWFTGPDSRGYYQAAATASSYTLTLTDVAKLPASVSGGDACTEDEQTMLRGEQVLAAPVRGEFSFTLGEATSGPADLQGPIIEWQIANIDRAPYTWTIKGGSGSNQFRFPQFDGSTADRLQVTLENGYAWFYRYPSGSKRADRIVNCRVDFALVMTRQ